MSIIDASVLVVVSYSIYSTCRHLFPVTSYTRRVCKALQLRLPFVASFSNMNILASALYNSIVGLKPYIECINETRAGVILS